MEIRKLDKLLRCNFNVVFINALKQFWRTTRYFQCIGEPKKQSLLLYLSSCQITYTCKDGRTITAECGDVVYVPVGSEYRAELSDFKGKDAHTVGVNFHLLDENGQPLILSKDITVFHMSGDRELATLFHKVIQQGELFLLMQNRIVLLQILQRIALHGQRTMPPAKIAPALEYLSGHLEESPPVSQLAEMCNISEVYFRKQFKKNMGMTPIEFRNKLRFERARSYLEYGDISVQEIAVALGYATVSHFIKEFRQHTGCSPLQYRKKSKTAGNVI